MTASQLFQSNSVLANVYRPNSFWAKDIEQVEEINIIGKKPINETTGCQLTKQAVNEITIRQNDSSTKFGLDPFCRKTFG